ncbi:pyridoxal phosphate-dependent transferase [Tuber brumale]|nr:pyridoxal phosphate-dependent transferase [Tuber brumale]
MEPRPIGLVMQATTAMVRRVRDAIHSHYPGPNENPHSWTDTYGSKTTKATDVVCQSAAKLIGANLKDIIFNAETTESTLFVMTCVAMMYNSHQYIITSHREHRHWGDVAYHYQYLPIKDNGSIKQEHWESLSCPDTVLVANMIVDNYFGVIYLVEEIEKLSHSRQVFFYICDPQSAANITVVMVKWNDGLMSIPGPRGCGPREMGARSTHHEQRVRIDQLMSGGGQECGVFSGTPPHSQEFAFGEPCRIAPVKIQDNYIRKLYHGKQFKQFTNTKQRRAKAATKDPAVEIHEANLTEIPSTKADKNTGENRRKRKSVTSYSKMTTSEAENRLGLGLAIPGIPVKQMLQGKRGSLVPNIVLQLKRKIYQDLVNYITVGGYTTETNPDFKEASINDVVVFTIYPSVAQFKDETQQRLRLAHQKEIDWVDSSTGGVVVMDCISSNDKECVLIVEAKKAALGEAIKPCFLSLKAMRDSNGGGTVYGFVTIGNSWRMISFDGTFTYGNE